MCFVLELSHKYLFWQQFSFSELKERKISVATFKLWFQYAEIYDPWWSKDMTKAKAIFNYDVLQTSYLQYGLCSVTED